MSSTNEILTAEFEALRAEIAAAHEASGTGASGKWAGLLKAEVAGARAAITAPSYINGRRPGNPPPSEAIEQWIKDKGIASETEKNISTGSLAFLIARKIGREGWQPNHADLIDTIVTPQRIRQILDRIGKSRIEDFTREALNYLKTLAA